MLDELERLEREATPGPWEITPKTWMGRSGNYSWTACGIESRDPELVALGGGAIAYAQSTGQIDEHDARLIAAARNALPALLRVARAVLAQRAADQAWEAYIHSDEPDDDERAEALNDMAEEAKAQMAAALAALEDLRP